MQPCYPHEFIMQPYRHHPDVLEARLTAFERDAELFAAGNLAARAVALDATALFVKTSYLTTIVKRSGQNSFLPTRRVQVVL